MAEAARDEWDTDCSVGGPVDTWWEEMTPAKFLPLLSSYEERGRALEVARSALDACDGLFAEIRNDWSDPRYECREGRGRCEAAIAAIDALSPTSGGGE